MIVPQSTRDCVRLYPLHILSRKWSYLILRVLRDPMTFSELQRELKYVTNHILTREIKLLQGERLIAMKNEKKYYLTREGGALYEAVEPLVQWSEMHAGRTYCPPSKKCSACLSYKDAVGVRNLVQIGKKA